MTLDPVSAAKLWLLVRPIRRMRQWRTRRKMASWYAEHPDEVAEGFNSHDEVSMDVNSFAVQAILAALRHLMTAAPFAGVAISDDLLVQTATVVVGIAGFLWSLKRKAK